MKGRRRLFAIVTALWLSAALLWKPVRAAGPADPPGISARCAIVMDADSGAVLYGKEPDSRCLIASTTKIMTGYLVCREMDLDAPVVIPAEAVGVEGSSMYLRAGEEMTGRDLLYGLMLHSGNDAAEALSILCSGSEAAFVAEMNRTARELGLTATHYANPHGLDSDDNYSTARDLARLAAAALKEDTFRRTVSAKTTTVAGDRVLTNHNKLLWRCDGCIGVKTGYTKAAGRILVSAAEREGRRLVCVTLNAPDDWTDHCALFDWGFACFEPRVLARKGESLMTAPGPSALFGDSGARPLLAAADLTVPMLREETVRMEYLPRFTPALDSSRDAGTVRIWLEDRLLAEVPVTWEAEERLAIRKKNQQ